MIDTWLDAMKARVHAALIWASASRMHAPCGSIAPMVSLKPKNWTPLQMYWFAAAL